MIKLRTLILGVLVFLSLVGCFQADHQAEQDGVLFQDDFSEPGNDWGILNSEDGVIEYTQGGLRIFVRKPYTDLWTVAGKDFSNAEIQVQATLQNTVVNNSFGVICGYQNHNRFYMLLVSSDGYFGVLKKNGENYSLIGQDQLKYSDGLLEKGSTYQLRAICKQGHLLLYVDGERLFDVQEVDDIQGKVGLIAGALSEPGVDILFDHFIVKEP